MEPDEHNGRDKAVTGRNYGGVRITPPPRQSASEDISQGTGSAGMAGYFSRSSLGRSQQARILTGSALFGVIVVVLLHELGHWVAGLAVTGQFPDFLLVAVRQKVTDFSTIGGVIVWGSGPVLQLAAVWAIVIYVTSRSRSHPRLFTIAGGILLFTVAAHLFVWAGATFTSQDSWGNDLPKVATFFGSLARVWMHLLSAAFMAALLLPAYVWLTVARSTGRQGLYLTPSIVGAIQGGVLVVIATFAISLSQ